MKNKNKFVKFLNDFYKSKYVWEVDSVWAKKARDIGMSTKSEDMSREVRKVIEDSISDIYNSRDF